MRDIIVRSPDDAAICLRRQLNVVAGVIQDPGKRAVGASRGPALGERTGRRARPWTIDSGGTNHCL
jgi:hypothetical protein